ncbi:TonB-dependent receptor [Pseudozobellia sp. WGM2]|uniref:SusC/RagA family TonB-linked outer membrane protein n=1 Tax=Pseudozobellia sp. WGM2 TaxID=2787625 RepID=UPI001AE051F2|nr:TonB-dependent receptor [Pseudozobellia sp. WGM2]
MKIEKFNRESFLLLLLFLTSLTTVVAQADLSVNGVVTDAETGEPLPGVSIVIKNTTRGTTTDFDGNYAINAENNGTLVFSYVGFKSLEEPIQGRANINISLQPDNNLLDEVVVVGYGTQKKSDVTGAVASADIETFRNQGNTSIVQSLQGTVAGLNVGVSNEAGGDVSFSVRGQNNFGGSEGANTPLIVVDGIIFRGSLQDINPDDVQSIDVLKDASSTAIYGSQAANGVIIVTTKSGKVSGGSGKPVFNYSTRYSFKKDANRLEYGSREDYLDQKRAFKWPEAYPQGDNYNPDYNPVADLDPQEVAGFENGTNVDWQDLLTRTGFVNNHNLSIGGSTDNITYFVSGSFLDNEEVIKGDNFSKITGRVNLELKLNNWLKIGTNSFVTSADYSGIEFSRSAYTYSPFAAAYDEDGNIVSKVTERFGNSTLLTENDLDDDKRTHLNTTIYTIIDIPWVEGLSYRMNYNNSTRTRKHNQYLFKTSDRVSQGSKDLFFNKDWTMDHILSYNKIIKDVHNLNLTAVYGREERYIESTESSGTNFSNELLGFNDLSLASTLDIQSGAEEESSLYQMGRINYNYDGKYYFTGTVRRDGFSGFGRDNKFAIFPSVALGWTLSRENFLVESNVVSNLKLRGSYGQSGNRALPRYSTLAKVDQNNAYVFGDGGTTVGGQFTSTIAAAGLKWETTTGLNIGLDFGLFNNRISGNIEYYNTDTEDILINIDIPSLNGFSTAAANLGKVHNTGFEFNINSINVQTSDFQWTSALNFSTNRNEVVSVLGKDDDGDGIEDDLPNSGFFIGEQLGVIYDLQIDPDNPIYQFGDADISGIYEPGYYRVVDQNGGGVSIADDRIILGNTAPAYRFGISNNFNYKNFNLSVFINSIQGGKNGYLGNNSYWRVAQWDPAGRGKVNGLLPVIVDYWTPDNPNSEYPSLRYDNIGSEFEAKAFKDRSFVRLQDVSLSYTFNSDLMDKIGIKNLTLVASGKNLHTWTKWKGIDPEITDEDGNAVGISYERPVTRNYTLGLNLSF